MATTSGHDFSRICRCGVRVCRRRCITISLIASANEVAFGQPVTFVAKIPDGVALVGKSIMDRDPCQVIYFPWNNTLHLVNDDGTALVGGDAGVAIGAAQSLANSRCVVHPSLSTSSPVTGGVRIDVRLSFVGATFAGVKKAYAVAFGSGGLVTHWVDAGTLTVQ